MIELTENQVAAMNVGAVAPERFVNPVTREAFVLVPVEEYNRLMATDYDSSPLTREELECLAWEMMSRSPDWPEYDDAPESA